MKKNEEKIQNRRKERKSLSDKNKSLKMLGINESFEALLQIKNFLCFEYRRLK